MFVVERRYSASAFAVGVCCGAAAMALVDPRRGAARRAWLVQKARSLARQAKEAIASRSIDVAQRSRGRLYEITHSEQTVPDDLLVERVRAQIGKRVSHPRAVDVRCEEGRVILVGPILKHEVENLIDIVWKVRGVKAVESRLEEHENPGSVPSLQDGTPHGGPRT